MAKLVFTDGSVTINSVDLSDHIARVTINRMFEDVTTTSVADTAVTRIAGLEDGDVQFDFHQDFAASSTEATVYPLVGTTTTVVVKATSGTVSTTNPSYTATVLVTEWPIIDAQSGQLLTSSVTWPVSGGWTKTTS